MGTSELLHPVSSFFHEWPRISSMVRLGSRILFHRASLCSFICRLRILSRWSRRFCSISSLLCLSRSKKPCHRRRVVKAIQSFTGSPDLLNFVRTRNCLSLRCDWCLQSSAPICPSSIKFPQLQVSLARLFGGTVQYGVFGAGSHCKRQSAEFLLASRRSYGAAFPTAFPCSLAFSLAFSEPFPSDFATLVEVRTCKAQRLKAFLISSNVAVSVHYGPLATAHRSSGPSRSVETTSFWTESQRLIEDVQRCSMIFLELVLSFFNVFV